MEAELFTQTPIYIWEKHELRDHPEGLSKKKKRIKKEIIQTVQTAHLER